MTYVRQLDGIRALAIASVVLFHAGFDRFSGGFVGVDVFFVLSGYLMATIVMAAETNSKFSIIDFGLRRARRILPALFVMALATIPFAWLWLHPEAMKDFAQSLVALAGGATNFLFYLETGYFDTDAQLKPLLHTWSLAIELQFYLLVPLLALSMNKLGRRATVLVVVSLTLVSFAFSVGLTAVNPSAGFFLLPSRLWEFLIGACLALVVGKKTEPRQRGIVGEIWSMVGALLIVFPVLLFDKATPFPGFWALLPTTGTALLIVFASQHTMIGKILGSKPFVGLGLISFSLYLWHYPVFSFARSLGLEPSREFIALIVISLGLSLGSYWLVEKPFRSRVGVPTWKLNSVTVVSIVFLVSFGLWGHTTDGFKTAPESLAYPVDRILADNIAVIGDSHGAHLVPGLETVTEGSVTDLTGVGCLPLRNVDRYDSRFVPGECAEAMNAALDQIIQTENPTLVILSSMGPVYLDGTTFRGKDEERVTGQIVQLIDQPEVKDPWEVYEIGLRRTLEELVSAKGGHDVVLAIDVPELGIDHGCNPGAKEVNIRGTVLRDEQKRLPVGECFVPRSEYDERSERYKNLVKAIAKDFPGVKVFDPTDLFCSAQKCVGHHPVVGYLYSDVDHLSEAGSRYFAEGLADFLNGASGLSTKDESTTERR
jgi:peptidoglycan/LPS O-acetylase OafA/YrhL